MVRLLRRLMVLSGACASALVVLSCAGGARVTGQGNFGDVLGKDWALEEIRVDSAVSRVDRTGGGADFFTLRFDAERASGSGAPNRYTAPYTPGEGGALAMGMAVSTRMAPLFETSGLKETEFFAYLGKVSGWSLRDGKLELKSSSENGNPVVMIFQEKK